MSNLSHNTEETTQEELNSEFFYKEIDRLEKRIEKKNNFIKNILNGIQSGAITSDHDETLADALSKALEALK